MDIVTLIYLVTSIIITTLTLYLTYQLLRVARKSLLSKILYDLLIVVLILWSHSIADILSYSILGEFGLWNYYFVFENILLPVAALYLIWDVISYALRSKRRRDLTG